MMGSLSEEAGRCPAGLVESYRRAGTILEEQDWNGIAGEISQTGEEDPLAMVDDPDLKEVVAAKMEMRRSTDRPQSYQPDAAESDLRNALDVLDGETIDQNSQRAKQAWARLERAAASFLTKEMLSKNQDQRIGYLSLLHRFRAALEVEG